MFVRNSSYEKVSMDHSGFKKVVFLIEMCISFLRFFIE